MSEKKSETKPKIPAMYILGEYLDIVVVVFLAIGLLVILKESPIFGTGSWMALWGKEGTMFGFGIMLCGYSLRLSAFFLISLGEDPKKLFEKEKGKVVFVWQFGLMLVYTLVVVYLSNHIDVTNQFRLLFLLHVVNILNFFCWLIIRYYQKLLR